MNCTEGLNMDNVYSVGTLGILELNNLRIFFSRVIGVPYGSLAVIIVNECEEDAI